MFLQGVQGRGGIAGQQGNRYARFTPCPSDGPGQRPLRRAGVRTELADEAGGISVAADEITDMARDHPDIAKALVALHHRYRDAAEQAAALAPPGDSAALVRTEPHDEVRDFFYAHHNHFDALDTPRRSPPPGTWAPDRSPVPPGTSHTRSRPATA